MSGIDIATLFNDPKTMGTFPEADLTGQEGVEGEGPFMRMHLKFTGEIIQAARFETYGCPYAVACGSWVTQWVAGKTFAQAGILDAEALSRILGGLPLGKEHCAHLAVKSLQDGLRQERLLQKEGADA